MGRLENIEKNFSVVSRIKGDYSQYPFSKDTNSQVETNQEKSKKFSEVFTPLWLADEMIDQIDWDKFYNTYNDEGCQSIDLCAGYGQFTVRMLRKFKNEYWGFDEKQYLLHNHYFSELQLESCYKIITSFSVQINLFIGDAMHLHKVPASAKGFWIYLDKPGMWVNLSKTVRKLFGSIKGKTVNERADIFAQKINNIIQLLNNTYMKHEKALKGLDLRDPDIRNFIISQINKDTADTSWQSNDTPESIIADMVDCVDGLEFKRILVLFNVEIVKYLVDTKKLDRKNITFLTDKGSEIEGAMVKSLFGVNVCLRDRKIFTNGELTAKKQYDVCISNPPYGDKKAPNTHLLILNSLLKKNISKEYVFVHPSTWILDMKGINSTFNQTKSLLEGKINYVKFFNGNFVFGINQFTPCMITHIDVYLSKENINVSYFGDNFNSKLSEITLFGRYWNKLKNLYSDVSDVDNVTNYLVKKINNSKHYCQLAGIRGNVEQKGMNINSALFKDDFYTMVMKNSDKNKGARKDPSTKEGKNVVTVEFNSELERDNFINYLKTDFARICLAFIKTNQQNGCGAMKCVPWLDFTQEWNDEKLFAHFNVDKETQDYIREFLPDYYGIRS